MFHTPPPIDTERSWMAEQSEQESYGIDKESNNTSSHPQGGYGGNDDNSSHLSVAIPGRAHSIGSGLNTTGDDKKTASDVSSETGAVKLPEYLEKMVDRFIESLKVPRYSTPLSGDDIASLYQQFYIDFKGSVEKFLREKTRMRSVSAAATPQALETYQEITEKKKERNRRPQLVDQYLELAEKKATEAVYDKLLTLSFSGDKDVTVNDQIHQRINILRQIPVTLDHLDLKDVDVVESELFGLLSNAGEELTNMNEAKNAKEKLEYLLKAHKVIVMTLSDHLKSKSSSADLILPALIYTVMYYDTPDLWLNFQFITRFRNSQFLQGEHLYCLTNFEASIRFLQNVTLASIGVDASPEGLDTSVLDEPVETIAISTPAVNSNSNASASTSQQPMASSSSSSAPWKFGGNSSNARKFGLLHPTDIADQSFKTLGSTYRFLVGKFTNEKSFDSSNNQSQQQPRYPNTLDDARKVVGLDQASIASTNSSQGGSNPTKKIPPPIERLVNCQTDDLTLSDIRNLHEDYIRLVNSIKSIDAFQE